MSKIGTLALALAVAMAAYVPAADDKPAKKGKTHVIKMLDAPGKNRFDPKELTIAVGDSVVWENAGKHVHNATSEDEGKTFSTKVVKVGAKSKAFTFSKAGKHPYECTYHEGMTGTIVVK